MCDEINQNININIAFMYLDVAVANLRIVTCRGVDTGDQGSEMYPTGSDCNTLTKVIRMHTTIREISYLPKRDPTMAQHQQPGMHVQRKPLHA